MALRKKIALIGGGNIGGTLAYLCAIKQLGDIVILDYKEGVAKGKALDILQSSAAYPYNNSKITGTSDYAEIAGADVIIVTAGLARKPGMSRDDLLSANANVMKTVAEGVKKHAPNAFVIIVTNPLDIMVYAFQKYSGLPTHKVVGMAGVLDSARFCTFLAEALQVSVQDIRTLVLGGHGDAMVPLIRYTEVGGIPLTQLIEKGVITQKAVDDIVLRTRGGGGEIVALLGDGSAYYAPATSAIVMLEAYIHNKNALLPCAAYLNGEYGLKGVYMGVPAIIGGDGVKKVMELNLNNEEKTMFDASVKGVKDLINSLETIDPSIK